MNPINTTSDTASKHHYRVVPDGKFYFLYGENEPAMNEFKNDIVNGNLDVDQRDENYTELTPTSANGLKGVLADLESELTTYSLLPDAKRVVTLNTCRDFFTAGATTKRARTKKPAAKTPKGVSAAPTPSEHLARLIENELLPKLAAVLIIIVKENSEKYDRVSKDNPVVKLATKLNAAYEFKAQNTQWLFLDALFDQNTAAALSLWRQWYKETGGAPKMYGTICSNLRLLIQAKVGTSSNILKAHGLTKDKLASDYFPNDSRNNVLKLASAFRRKKLERAAARFTLSHLLDSYERFSDLMKYAIPLSTDVYVPDRGLLAEYWIIRFTAGMAQQEKM